MLKKLLLVAVVTVLANVGTAQAQYPFGNSVYTHRDGLGTTTRSGNSAIVQRWNGSVERYDRSGNWQYYQNNNGVFGARYFDDSRGVTRFDYRDPATGARVIGENPYPNNPYGSRWSIRSWGW